MIGQRLPGEEMLATGIRYPHLGALTFPPLGQYHRALGGDGAIDDVGISHHTRKNFQTFVQACLCGLGQVECISGAGRRRDGVAVAAEGHTQTLPDTFGFAVRHMARPSHRQMLHIMGVSHFIGSLHQGTGIDPQPHRHLPRRHAVTPDGVAQPVGERAEMPGGIDRHVTIFIEPGARQRLRSARLGKGGRRLRLCDKRHGRHRQQQGENGERSGRTAGEKMHRPSSLATLS